MKQCLNKGELLSAKKEIEDLFSHGRSFVIHPFKVIWKMGYVSAPHSAQVLFSVPKKKMSRAVQRNLLKRRMREAYRLHKEAFLEGLKKKGTQMVLAFVYIENETVEFSHIEKKIILSLNRLVKEHEKNTE